MYTRSNELVRKKFFEYLLPTMLTAMAVTMATVVDSIIVGNLLGDESLAVIGLASPVIFCINLILVLFAGGGVTLAAIARGQRQKERANRIFTLAMLVGFLAMLVFVVVAQVFMYPITNALAGGDAALQREAEAYIRPTVFVGPLLHLAGCMAFFIRTDGKPRHATMISLTANLVNLVLDYVLIRFFNTGIAGAAVSTVIGYIFGVLVVIPYLLSKQRTFHFQKLRRQDLGEIKNIVGVGLPKSTVQAMSMLRALVLNGIVVAALGAVGMSVMTVCVNTLMIANIFIVGTSDTLLPIVGTLYGEKDYFGIRKTVRTAFWLMLGACLAIMLFFLAAPGVVGGWFGIREADTLAVLVPALRMYALSLPLFGVNQLLQNFYTTTGHQKLASALAALEVFVFVVLFALVFAGINANLLWLCFAASEVCTLGVVLAATRLLQRKGGAKGILMLAEQPQGVAVLDVTIPATVADASTLSGAVADFCAENGVDEITANRTAVAVEEMAVNTAQYSAGKKGAVIDVAVRVSEEDLTIRLRDSGAMFNPTLYTPEEEAAYAVDGIEVVKRLAEKITYDWQLGMNTTLIALRIRH